MIMDKDENIEGNTMSSSASQVLVSSVASSSLHDMSSLYQHLPLKRGLSKHYQGKSQSFTCLSNVRCVEDLAKPENPYYKKKLKSCKSYGGGLSEEINDTGTHNHKPSLPKPLHSIFLSKKASRKSFSQINLNAKSRPSIPVPPHTSPSSNRISNQTPLFA